MTEPGCICHVLGRDSCPQHNWAALDAQVTAGVIAERARITVAVEGIEPFCDDAADVRDAVLAIVNEAKHG